MAFYGKHNGDYADCLKNATNFLGLNNIQNEFL